MQYKVPQDVQREDTIIGPITLKQMGILGVGGGIAYILYVSLAKSYYAEVWLPPVVIVSAITLAFAFLKIANMPFHLFLMNFIEYNLLAKKRFWIQGGGTSLMIAPTNISDKKGKAQDIINPAKQEKSIEELTNILDTHGESELSKEDKKKGLKELINQNYK
jgi:hypothetical protein